MRFYRTLAACLAVMGVPQSPANAMDYRRDGVTIFASGKIVSGDAKRLRQVVQEIPHEPDAVISFLTVSFNSPGGDLYEGMRLGLAIREVGAATLVQRDRLCASACAVAFLGGVIKGATSDQQGRFLEVGGQLGYHGYSWGSGSVRLENETLDQSRVINALILAYAAELGGVDAGFLASAFNTQPKDLLFITSPGAMAALTIQLRGPLPPVPRNWPVNACVNAVRKSIASPNPRAAQERVHDDAEPIRDVADFAHKLLDDRFPGEDAESVRVRASVARLGGSDLADLVSGQMLELALGGAAYRVTLQRGAGFYYDSCFAIRTSDEVRTLMVDGVGHSTQYFSGTPLSAFAPDQSLWEISR